MRIIGEPDTTVDKILKNSSLYDLFILKGFRKTLAGFKKHLWDHRH